MTPRPNMIWTSTPEKSTDLKMIIIKCMKN